MTQARDEAGNIWEVDAQGNPVRLIQAAPAQGNIIPDPTAAYEAPKAEADIENIRTNIADKQADNARENTKMQADLFAQGLRVGANGQIERIPGWTPAEAPKAIEPLKLSQFRALEQQLARVRELYEAGPGKTKGIYGIADYMPTDINAAFDSAGAGLSEVGLAAFRVPGVGAQSDTELRQFVQANTPRASDRDSAILEKLRNLETRLAATKKELGLGGDQEQVSAFEIPRLQNLPQNTQASGFDAETQTLQIPDEMQRLYNDFVAKGDFTPESYAAFRAGLDYRFFPDSAAPDFKTYEDEGARILQGIDGARTQNLTIPGPEVPLSGAERRRNNLANSAGVPAFVNAANSAGFGAIEAIAPDQMAAMNEANPMQAIGGQVAGSFGGVTALGRLGASTIGRAAPQLMGGAGRAQFGRNLAADATYGGIYGGVTDGDPLSGAVLGGVGSAAGQGVGAALGNTVGGMVQSDAAQNLLDRGVRLTTGRRLGGTAARAEDLMQSIPIVGDMVRGRQLDSFQDLQLAALREGGEPIGFTPTRGGPQGLDDLGNARSAFYDNTLSNVNAPLGEEFIQDMMPVRDLAQGLSQGNRRKLGETINDAMQIPADAGSISGPQYQDALVALKRLRNNPGEAMPNAARTLRSAATASIKALDNAVTRGAGPDVVDGLSRANQSNRAYKTLEDAMNRASGGSQTGEIFLPTANQLQRAGMATQKKYPGPRPFAELADNAQQVLPSTVPNSGTTDRALFAAGLGTLGLGGAGASEYATTGQANTTASAASLAAALALLGTRGGQAALNDALFERPNVAKRIGEQVRRRAGLFGSGTGGALVASN